MNGKNELESASFVRTIDCNGSTLQIKQLYFGTVGCVVWDAALVLCRFLENRRYFAPNYWTGKQALELGSGTGAVGLAAAALGADALLTDLPEVIPLIKDNIALNEAVVRGRARATPLIWGQDVSPDVAKPDVILMADTVYHEKSVNDLVKTLLDVSSHWSLMVMAYEQRTTGDKPQIEKRFMEMMKTYFCASLVPTEDLDEEYRCDEILVVMWKRKDPTHNGFRE